jgi:endonuclease-8
MPEGDTVRRLADRIARRFLGERVQRCISRHPSIATLDLTGQRLRQSDAVGKHLLLHFDDLTLHGHLRMDGRWTLGPRATEPEWRRRLELEMETGWMTALDMPVLEVVRAGDEDRVVGHLGPDLCGPTAPDLDEVLERLGSRPDRPIAAALLDQRNVAGFGNLYAIEVPFICAVSPFQPIGRVEQLDTLIEVGTALIRTNASRGPQNTTGRRLDTSQHWIYGRHRALCPRCPGRIERLDDASSPWGRVTYWCPLCQAAGPIATVDRARVLRLLALHPAVRVLRATER